MSVMREFSSGGIIFKDGKVLIILMNTITGKKIWTFPKGHIEEGETPTEAALREVLEETGFLCRIVDDKVFYISRYFFERNGRKVSKTVYWYLMEPLEDKGKIQTACEVEKVKWVDVDMAYDILVYDSDKEIVRMLKDRLKNGGIKDGV